MNQKQKKQNEFWTAVVVLVIVSTIIFKFFLTKGQKNTSLLPLKLFWNSVLGQNKTSDTKTLTAKVQKLRLPILMYHHIGTAPNPTDELRKDLTVSPEDFEKQVAWIKASGFETINLENLFNFTKGKFKMPEKPIIFTFDDGYEDVFINAVPILKKYGFTGSFAIITQFPGIQYADNIYASWQQIRNAKNLGMEIISHTQDHFDGTNSKYSQNFILKNLQESQKDLQKNLSLTPLPILIYPYGHYGSNYIEAARTAGFRLGLTTNFGKIISFDKLMEIPRVRVRGGESLDIFKKLLLE
jgi:peptidoglycan/xylan/chitin deacetylase (PgdA/CDA1 family)